MATEAESRDIRGALSRVKRLIEAARGACDITSESSLQLRRQLLASTGLSAPSIELGLTASLELTPSHAELEALCRSVPVAPRAWVVLSANVFVAAHRAIALGLACSEHVFVKPSRRDPVLAEYLHNGDQPLFTLVDRIEPQPGDHVFAYGSDTTMQQLQQALPEGVVFHAHGNGVGAAFVSAQDDVEVAAAAIARDIVLFDQRGCLSPRLVAIAKDADRVRFTHALASSLQALEHTVPSGPVTTWDLAERTWYREVSGYVGTFQQAGQGWVGLFEDAGNVPLPPAQRCISVFVTRAPASSLLRMSQLLTVVAANDATLQRELAAAYPAARLAELGSMQTPPFDGPVDLRTWHR